MAQKRTKKARPRASARTRSAGSAGASRAAKAKPKTPARSRGGRSARGRRADSSRPEKDAVSRRGARRSDASPRRRSSRSGTGASRPRATRAVRRKARDGSTSRRGRDARTSTRRSPRSSGRARSEMGRNEPKGGEAARYGAEYDGWADKDRPSNRDVERDGHVPSRQTRTGGSRGEQDRTQEADTDALPGARRGPARRSAGHTGHAFPDSVRYGPARDGRARGAPPAEPRAVGRPRRNAPHEG